MIAPYNHLLKSVGDLGAQIHPLLPKKNQNYLKKQNFFLDKKQIGIGMHQSKRRKKKKKSV